LAEIWTRLPAVTLDGLAEQLIAGAELMVDVGVVLLVVLLTSFAL